MAKTKKCCKTCVYCKRFSKEYTCDNEEAEAYGLEVLSDDSCEEWEKSEDKE